MFEDIAHAHMFLLKLTLYFLSYPFPSKFMFCFCYCNFFNWWSHFELVIRSGLWNYLLKHGYFLIKCWTLLPKTFKYEECFRKCLDFMTFYSRIFIGFKLYRFCEERHHYYEFSYMIKLPCLTNSVTLKLSFNSAALQSPDPEPQRKTMWYSCTIQM